MLSSVKYGTRASTTTTEIDEEAGEITYVRDHNCLKSTLTVAT